MSRIPWLGPTRTGAGACLKYKGKRANFLFRKEGVTAGARLERGDPAAAIATGADKINADLIAFSTHGKSGAAAFWTQSIGANVLAQTRRPMLMVPV